MRLDPVRELPALSGLNAKIELTQVGMVKLGDQIWSTENLSISEFKNGDSIYQARTREEWEQAGRAGRPAWCNCENSLKNDSIYGKLYNWYAVNYKRGLAREGWRIPS